MPAFDTHKAVKALCHAGFDDAQAEAVVEQINGAVNENVATKTDLEKLATKEAVATLATKQELAEAVEKLATKEAVATLATKQELAEAVATLATKQELREAVATLATKQELREAVEKLELRLTAELEKQATRYLKIIVAAGAVIVGLTKALDLLLG